MGFLWFAYIVDVADHYLESEFEVCVFRAVTWLTVYRAPQFVTKVLAGFSKNVLTKIKIARPPVVRSALKPSHVGLICTASDGSSERSRKIL